MQSALKPALCTDAAAARPEAPLTGSAPRDSASTSARDFLTQLALALLFGNLDIGFVQ